MSSFFTRNAAAAYPASDFLGDLPKGLSLREVQERAAYAAQKAAHYAATGLKSQQRIWENAAKRLQKELLAKLRELPAQGLSDLELLGRKRRMESFIGTGLLAAIGAAAYYAHRKP